MQHCHNVLSQSQHELSYLLFFFYCMLNYLSQQKPVRCVVLSLLELPEFLFVFMPTVECWLQWVTSASVFSVVPMLLPESLLSIKSLLSQQEDRLFSL